MVTATLGAQLTTLTVVFYFVPSIPHFKAPQYAHRPYIRHTFFVLAQLPAYLGHGVPDNRQMSIYDVERLGVGLELNANLFLFF